MSNEETRDDTVVIATLHPGMVSAFYCYSLIGTLLHDQAERHVVGLLQRWASANVSAPRNDLTAMFLENHTADWLLWIDSDMAWEPSAVEQLLEVADKDTAPIVGGLCFGAAEDVLFPTIYQFMTDQSGAITTLRVNEYERDTLIRCAATGAAFLLIHRSALETIRDSEFSNPTFPWFQEGELAGKPAGEDIALCMRAARCGIPVHVYTKVKVGHHKSRLLTEEIFQKQLAEVVPDGV